MVLNNIEQLLEKYDNAETTLKEEQVLREYFAQDEVEPHLEPYRAMFQYFQQTKQEHYTKDVPLKSKKTQRLYQWISVAAVAVLMIGFYLQRRTDEERAEALYAYNQTKAALGLLTSNFNEGTTSMTALNMASSNINEGISGMNALSVAASNFETGTQHLNYMSEFSKQTNKLLKTSN